MDRDGHYQMETRLHNSQAPMPGSETTGRTIHWAALYDAVTGCLLRLSEHSVIELAHLQPGEKVLDVGCGPGRLTLALKARLGESGEVHGIDAAPEMIALARHKAAKAGAAVAFQVGLAEALPFPDNHFDVVVSRLVIHHLPGDLKRKAFAEMRRVLRTGGHCLVVDFGPPSNPLTWLLGKLLQTDVREYPAMMAEAGFADVEMGLSKSRLLSFVRGETGKTPTS
jgi:SAM-dependent methyltransferase